MASATSGPTAAAPDAVRLFGPLAIRAQIAELAAMFRQAGGIDVALTLDLNPAVAARILAGEAFDLGITNPGHVGALIAAGRADPASHAPFVRVPLAIARRGEAADPTPASAEAIRELLRGAGSIGYTAAGTSGRTFLDLIDRLGLSDEIGARLRPIDGGAPAVAAAAGEVDLAIAPLTTALAAPGVAAAAIFPSALGGDIDMSMVLPAGDARSGAAALARFLADPALDAHLAARGMVRFHLA